MRPIILISVILFCCSTKSSEDKLSQEALMLHNSMVKKANQIDHRLNELKRDSSVNQDSVVLLSEALERWKLDLVEVPGNDVHDGDHHGHVHSGNNRLEVTGKELLAIQKALDERLSAIGNRIFHLKPEPDHVDHEH